ncbi:hypothetical protein [Metamycoplasma hyosynoviae]|uniref:Uncharacterized protein n=1 Tax=Metamycoplasma hyosynoviae TaxID=29559 RepID=A0A063YHU7_9BACT|nr:hypothetical protein [Metamycoplasma hyosynoviae]KDE41825.1 hypothetical protein NPL3_03020 [Metamycoplasma hyosynoviae]KDE42075.1 hypothetical protein NPL7_01360 [Metamycoplasma hyosynoviae]KDE42826.1 hypothetical protein NPL5_03545 [Metamycoplasma hyosynoviae]KDE44276.1 hypothetical protein NPL6_02100 [Metamycoplasma hyosynoviae]KDE44450.1 hypothetical protein NPL2_03100 [Metamycoplasma hyosynoviae]
MNKSKKIFIGLGLSVVTIPLFAFSLVSCESNLRIKLNSRLKKNKSLRGKVETKTGINNFPTFEKDIRDELANRLATTSDKTERKNIFNDIIKKVDESNQNLTLMKESID